MKSLVEYIFETKYFRFTEEERAAVTELVGYLTSNIGEESDIKKYSEYWNVLADDEKEQMNDLYDFVEDVHNWPIVNRNNIKDDISALREFLNWVDEKDLWGDCEYDGPSALEKLEE